jgi:Zn-dependent protease
MIFAGASLSTGTLLGCLLREYMVINLALMMFNLIPVPPLDGGRIAVGLLPLRQARALSAVEPFGFLVVLVLAQLGVTGKIVVVPVLGALTALAHILGG